MFRSFPLRYVEEGRQRATYISVFIEDRNRMAEHVHAPSLFGYKFKFFVPNFLVQPRSFAQGKLLRRNLLAISSEPEASSILPILGYRDIAVVIVDPHH